MSSGLFATLGGAAESDYGVYEAPGRWLEFDTETLERRKNAVTSMGLRGGGRFPRAARRVVPTSAAGGAVTMAVATKGMGLPFTMMLGSSATAVQQGGTAAYRQIHSAGSLAGKSMTLQKGVPRTDGTVQPFTYLGCKVLGWTLSVEPGGLLMLSLELDARQEETDTALVAASYSTTAEVLHFAQGVLKLGGTASTTSGLVSVAGGTQVAEIYGVSVTGTNPMKADRYPFGGGGLKAEPIDNALAAEYGGTLTGEFGNTATIYDAFAEDASLSMELTFTGSTISGAHANKLSVVVPALKFEGETPKVGGPDVVPITAPFKVFDDGTNAGIQLVYTSTDTAV